MLRPPRIFTLFPYTTLFRSDMNLPSVVGHLSESMSQVNGFSGKVSYRANHPLRVVCGIGRNPLMIGISVSSSTRSEEHTSELQSLTNLVCRLLLEKKNK